MSRLVLVLLRLSQLLHRWKVPLLPYLLVFVNRILFYCYVGPGAKIGRNVSLGYGGIGVVIHHQVVIGDDVRIGANVVIGERSKLKGVPVIGNRVLIHTGAKVLGPIRIGDEAVIGANAVVVRDVEPRTVVVGVPARVLKSNIDIRAYHDGMVLTP